MAEQAGLIATIGAEVVKGVCSQLGQWRDEGLDISRAHLRHLNPFPANLGEILSRYERVLVPELNTGQLRMLVRARFLVDADGNFAWARRMGGRQS